MRLIVGLGNPGPRYKETRHNAGFLVLDVFAARHGASFRAGRHGEEARVGNLRLLKPSTFMNRSGTAVQAVATKNGISPEDILVVHDDLDLPLGRLRIRAGGGAGGQKGVQDIIACIGPNFLRLKVGIGRPPEHWTTENWVLSRFTPDERDLTADVLAFAADAIDRILTHGHIDAANTVNGHDLRPRSGSDVTGDDGDSIGPDDGHSIQDA